MKRLLSAVLTVGIVATGVSGVAAQESGSATASGFDAPATYFDDRGNEVATVEVNDINQDWTDYDDYSEPDRGYVYRAVDFTVTNTSDASLIVENYDFSMLDASGRNQSSAYATAAETSDTTLFSEDLPLAAGESADLTLVFETPADVDAAALVWQPDSGIIVLVDFGLGDVENGALANGFGSISTWTDDRGNPVATLEVTEIESDWQDYDDYSEPERGSIYQAVHFTITNVSDSSLIVEPYSISMIDSTGLNSGRSYASVAEGSDTVLFEEDAPLAAGESLEGVMIFQTYDDTEPAALVWQPDSGLLNIIQLTEAGEGAPAESDATPSADEEEAAPAGDTQDATAAADDAVVGQPSSARATMSNETSVNGDPVVFVDAIEAEQGEIMVVSTIDGWEGFVEDQAPVDGTRFFLVTMIVNSTGDDAVQVAPLDFTVVTESGGEYDSDLYLNSETAQPQITESGQQVTAGGTTTVVIPFVVPDGEVPTSVIWNTGADTVEISLVP